MEAYLEKIGEVFDIHPVPDRDNVDGYEIIKQKQSIARNWFADQWKISFDALRDVVQRRQSEVDINTLRSQIELIQ